MGFLRAVLTSSLIPAFLAGAAAAEPRHRILAFDDLEGWAEDDHAAALSAFLVSCDGLEGPDWPALCSLAKSLPGGAARGFFEAAFRPVIAGAGRPALLTGYYEPELRGSRRRTARYRHPLHARPPEGHRARGLTRRQIEETGALRGHEIAWVEDPVEALFLGVQGSGRVRLAEGGTLRLGFGGANGHPRRSVGQEMIRRGILEPTGASAAAIRAWVSAHPSAGRELLRHDPSYVFFREVKGLSDESGPLGAMLRPLTAGRSVAVDPAFVPLGAPVWVEKGGAEPMRRLMVAQDTGSAIRGAQRADLFFGTGGEAGRRAGRVRDRGRIVTLLPIRMAHALAPGPLANATPLDSTPVVAAPATSPLPPDRPAPPGRVAVAEGGSPVGASVDGASPAQDRGDGDPPGAAGPRDGGVPIAALAPSPGTGSQSGDPPGDAPATARDGSALAAVGPRRPGRAVDGPSDIAATGAPAAAVPPAGGTNGATPATANPGAEPALAETLGFGSAPFEPGPPPIRPPWRADPPGEPASPRGLLATPRPEAAPSRPPVPRPANGAPGRSPIEAAVGAALASPPIPDKPGAATTAVPADLAASAGTSQSEPAGSIPADLFAPPAVSVVPLAPSSSLTAVPGDGPPAP